jgi:hypothetical protein
LTVTVPYWSSWQTSVAVGVGQVVGSASANLAPWRRGRPPLGERAAGGGSAVEAAVRPQPHQQRHPLLGQVEGQPGGVVAAVEDEQRDRPTSGQPAKQRTDLRCGGAVGVVQGVQAAGVHRRGPGVAVEAQLGDPLEGPAGDDRLTGRMAGGMVVVAALGRALGVTARPGGHIHREHQRVGGRQAVDQQVAQPLDLDATTGQRA